MTEQLARAAKAELHRILHWWKNRLPGPAFYGGFVGRIDGWGRAYPKADRAVILNARVLWTFSAAARATGQDDYRAVAERALEYFLRHFWDEKSGGVFWMLEYWGWPEQPKKQLYAQAFAVYALAEFYRLSGDREALDYARTAFQLIEKHGRDRAQGGYFEAFDQDWGPLADVRLSDKDANEAKTMNTHLHLLEAYANLYRADPDESLGEALKALIVLFLEKFIAPETAHLRLFFDENWRLKSDKISFGHDIEAAWLLTDAAETLGDTKLLAQTRAAAVRIADRTLMAGVDPADGGLWNEADAGGLSDRAKDWWPQAEAVVGFLEAWKISGDARYAAAAARSWQFIENNLLDRTHGEWLWGLRADGSPDRDRDKAGPWKCPYHNGRACLEIQKRAGREF